MALTYFFPVSGVDFEITENSRLVVEAIFFTQV